MSTGTFGNGTTLNIAAITITELTNIGLPGMSADDIDVTTHNDADNIRQFIKGLIDPGEVTFEGNMNYTDYAALTLLVMSASIYTSTIVVPTSPSVTTLAMQSYVKGLEAGAPHDDKVSISGSLKVSGKPVLTET